MLRELGVHGWVESVEEWLGFLQARNASVLTYVEKTANEVYEAAKVFAVRCRVLGSDALFRVWVFGSRARGTHRNYSDLDLLIELAEPWPSTVEKASVGAALRDAFEESDLPMKVDVVLASELLDAYRSQVFKGRVLLMDRLMGWVLDSRVLA